jgi:hypothetical protein
MKTAEANFHFPVLGFTPDKEIWGFTDLNRLTRCGPRTLKNDLQIGMELIDANGRRWIVRDVQRTGRPGALLPWLMSTLLTASAQSRIEHELDPLEPVSLKEAQERACAAMEAFEEDYIGESREKDFLPLLAKVKRTKKIADIYKRLQPDTFEGY